MTRAELLDKWLQGKMPNNLTRREFIEKHYKDDVDFIVAGATVDWIWNAGFNAGLEEGSK